MKRPAILLSVLIALMGLIWGSCTHEQLTSVCDTQNMSYKYNVAPILKNNCYLCHSKGNTAGSYGTTLLDSYENLVPSNWIIPGSPDSSILVGDISHKPPDAFYNYVPMPYMKHKLDTCSINQIAAWIKQGALDN